MNKATRTRLLASAAVAASAMALTAGIARADTELTFVWHAGTCADALMDIAGLQALLGRKQDALATIRKSRSSGYSDFFFPVIIPGFQPIRNDPEFKALFSPPRK